MELWELTAREEIRELVASYTHFGDGGRIDEMMKLFAPDATLNAFDTTYASSAEIAGFFSGIADGTTPGPPRTFIRHYISNVTIDVTGPDSATGASYWTVASDSGHESAGRYRDTYKRNSDGEWRFATRRIRRD